MGAWKSYLNNISASRRDVKRISGKNRIFSILEWSEEHSFRRILEIVRCMENLRGRSEEVMVMPLFPR